VHAKNGPIAFHYKLFFRLGWKPYIYIYIYPPLQRWGGGNGAPGFQTPLCVSLLSLSLAIKFLPVTPVLQPLILEHLLRARTL
jgi:hypothetical protein